MDHEPKIPEPSARQIRAARGFFCWTQPEASERFGIALTTLVALETGSRPSQKTTIRTIGSALVAHGVTFDDDGNMIMPAMPRE